MDTRALGREFLTKTRNPHGRNENSNTIYTSDPAHDSRCESGSAFHKGKAGTDGSVADIDQGF